jgi:hypothetical protein
MNAVGADQDIAGDVARQTWSPPGAFQQLMMQHHVELPAMDRVLRPGIPNPSGFNATVDSNALNGMPTC